MARRLMDGMVSRVADRLTVRTVLGAAFLVVFEGEGSDFSLEQDRPNS